MATSKDSFDKQADALLRDSFPADGPGAAAIVVAKGKVIYAGGRGLADVGAGRSITPDTPFRLGSIVKQFTAATVLKLVGEGKVSLDDPIEKFFPDWPKPSAQATVRQLLNHSSGLADFSKVPGWIPANRARAFTTAELLAVSRALPAKAPPGREWEYNNGGYVMLGAIIEKVTGAAWHQAITDRLMRPLGLQTIAYAAPDQLPASAALGYTGQGGRQQPIQLSHMSIAHAAGGLNGSVRDMASWAQALHHGRVIEPRLYREMTSPARLADGSEQPYGFGLRLREFRGRPALVHGGAGGGLDTDSVYIPSLDLFVAVFANSDEPQSDPSMLTRRLAALAVGEPIPTFTAAAIDRTAVEPLLGSYNGPSGPPRRFIERDGKLFLGRGVEERELFFAGKDRFFFGAGDLNWIEFERRPDGAHRLTFHAEDEGAVVRLLRTGAAPAAFEVAPTLLRSYAGRFQTETIAVKIAVDARGRLMLTPDGQEPVTLRPVSDTEFRVEGGPMRLIFHPEAGKVDRFTLHRGARVLNGRRVTQ